MPEERKIENRSPLGETVVTHPAFGCVTVTNWQSGGSQRLFGSDLLHASGIRLLITRAKMYRGLSQYRHFAGEILLELDLSMAQWARLVASTGLGGGVPVTLRSARVGTLDEMPGIAAPAKSRKELHGEEMAEALRERLGAILQLSRELGEAIDESKGKAKLRELQREIHRNAEQLPGSVEFVYKQFAEATEAATEDAKVEVESHLELTHRRIASALTSAPHHPPRELKADAESKS